MNDPNELSRTMRIDIHPDFLGESLARKKQRSATIHGVESTAVIASKARERIYSQDYEKLLQSIYDAVLITDAKGRIIDFNSRAVDFFLCEDRDLWGLHVVDLISGADTSLLSEIRRNLKKHTYTLIEAHCVRRDKSMFPAEVAVNRIALDQEGHLCFFIRDVSIRKQAQEALEKAVVQLEEHDRARSQFVSNVSHELRTPLTSMTYAIANMLRGVAGPVSDDLRRYLELLEGDCKRLLGTVNDILDLRKIESNTLTLSQARIPFARLVRRSAETLHVQAEQKSITMTVDASERKCFVDCDAQKMERVLLNLVGNAVKFTPDGGEIDVAVSDDPGDPSRVLLTVRDSGHGIPPEAIDRVTERYFTVGEQASGSGLGLSISDEIVTLHGGTLTMTSPPPGCDHGTLASVSLPVVDAPTVLVVDDEKAVLDILSHQISSQGYCVITAGDGEEALEMMAQRPNVVVLDLVLPKMEGTEVILRMKGDKSLMRIPVIVITGADIGRAKAQVLNNFAIPAMTKPWHEGDLLDRVEGALLGAAAVAGEKQAPDAS